MHENKSEHVALLLKENSPLLMLWVDFYTRLAAHLSQSQTNMKHKSFFAFYCAQQNPKNNYKLLQHLEELFSLPKPWQFQKLVPIQQLLLLPQEHIHKICAYSALSIHYHAISKIIEKEKILKLCEFVGQDGWHFAIRKGALYKAQTLSCVFAHSEQDSITCIKNTFSYVLDFCARGISDSLCKHIYALLPDMHYENCPKLDAGQSILLQETIMHIAKNEVEFAWKDMLF